MHDNSGERSSAWLTRIGQLLIGTILITSVIGCSSSKDSAESSFALMNDSAAPAMQQEIATASSGSSAKSNANTEQLKASTSAAAPAVPPNGLSLADNPGSIVRKIIYKANITMEVASYG